MDNATYQRLTEAAARACGFKIIDWYSNDDSHRLKLHVLEDGKYAVTYDPFHDNDAAMETAARLDIQISYSNMYVSASRTGLPILDQVLDNALKVQYAPGDLRDKMAAMRSAITHCAANYADNLQYAQYDVDDLVRRERELIRNGYEIKLDVSGGFWIASDGGNGVIGGSKAEAIMQACKNAGIN
jgi:hypothetical protein